MGKHINEEFSNLFIKSYLYKPISLESICNYYNISKPTGAKILKRYNIPIYKKAQILNPNLIENYFESIDREDKAYFLGLIVSDGNIFIDYNNPDQNRQSSISITLQDEDNYILNIFKNCVQTNTNITSDGRGASSIAIRSDIMANDLGRLGVFPQKSLIASLPIIDDYYMPHLIRGLFDGDGSIQFTEYAYDNSYHHKHTIGFSGSEYAMNMVKQYLCSKLNISNNSVYTYKDKSLSMITWGSLHDVIEIYKYLYSDCWLYMIRKRNKFEDILKYYNMNNMIIPR